MLTGPKEGKVTEVDHVRAAKLVKDGEAEYVGGGRGRKAR